MATPPGPRPVKPDPEPQPLNREQGCLGIIQTVALPLTFWNMADGLTVSYYAEPIAKGAAEVAANDPAFAAAVDKALRLGPYGALLTPVAACGLQIAANHGWLPAGQFGTKTKDELYAATLPPETIEEMKKNAEKTTSANGREASGVPA